MQTFLLALFRALSSISPKKGVEEGEEIREGGGEMHARVEGGRSTPMIAGCIGTPSLDSAGQCAYTRLSLSLPRRCIQFSCRRRRKKKKKKRRRRRRASSTIITLRHTAANQHGRRRQLHAAAPPRFFSSFAHFSPRFSNLDFCSTASCVLFDSISKGRRAMWQLS